MSWKSSVQPRWSIALAAVLALSAGFSSNYGLASAQASATDRSPAPGTRLGAWLPGARGVVGTATAIDASTLTLKLESGSLYTIHFDANTRILQMPNRPKRRAQQNAPRPHMITIAASDLHPGDVLTAVGDVNDTARSVGAVAIVRLDPARVAQLKTLETSYGKTWLAGSITSIEGSKITVLDLVNRIPHIVTTDPQTSIRRLRDSIALNDLKPGDLIRITGAPDGNRFHASRIRVMPARHRRDIRPATHSPSTGASA